MRSARLGEPKKEKPKADKSLFEISVSREDRQVRKSNSFLCVLCARESETDRCAKRSLLTPSSPSCLRGQQFEEMYDHKLTKRYFFAPKISSNSFIAGLKSLVSGSSVSK